MGAPWWISMSWLGRRAWMLVALLLFYSGLEKVLTQISASRELIDLGTIAGDAAARLPGGWWTLAGIELLLAGLLTIARTRPIGAAGVIVFLSVGIGLFALELSRPAPRSCGCLGGGGGKCGDARGCGR